MRRARLIALFLLAGGIATLVGGFCAGVLMSAMVSLSQAEPLALMPGSLFAGFLGAILGLRAFVPVTVLGGLLWSYRIRSKLTWTAAGLLGGLGLCGLLNVFPALADGLIGYLGPDWQIVLAVALAGVPAAFAFRLVMESVTAFDDDAPMMD